MVEPSVKTIVLISGGIDSVTLAYHASKKHDVLGAISFDYGAKHNNREIPYAVWHCERLGINYHVVVLKFLDSLFSSALLSSGGDIPDGHY